MSKLSQKIISHKGAIWNAFLIFLVFLPFILPASYLLSDAVNSFFKVYRIVLFLVVIFFYLKNIKISAPFVFLALMFLVQIIATLSSQYSSTSYSIDMMVSNLTIFCGVSLFSKFFKGTFFIVAKYLLMIISLAHIATMFIFYPNGMYMDDIGDHNFYLLNHDNVSFFYIFPAIIMSIISDFVRHAKIHITTILFILISIAAYAYVKSAAALVCLVAFSILLIAIKIKFVRTLINSPLPEIFFLVLLFTIINIKDNEALSNFISETFHKSSTISGRTRLWEIAKTEISKSPIIGLGFETHERRMALFGIGHIHNIFYQILYNGGIAMLLSSIIFYISCVFKKHSAEKTTCYTILKLSIFIYLIAGIFDFYLDKYLSLIPFALIANIGTINSLVPKETKNED